MSAKPRLLDLFSGAGGCAMGYHRAGFEVVGIDLAPQKRYPFEFHQADALDYLVAHGHEFDVIHASPPCQSFSRATPMNRRANHLNLIPLTRFWLKASGLPYIIENVPDAASHLIAPTMLCGTMFGLNVWRHRYFECSWGMMFSPATCRHDGYPVLITGTTRRKEGRFEHTVAQCREASGIDWMTRKELDQAIPPAYTKWIGDQLMSHIQRREPVLDIGWRLVSEIENAA